MEDIWQPEEVINRLIMGLKSETEIWQKIIAFWRESNELSEFGKRIGKRYDLEPDFFPQPKEPHLTETIGKYLRQKYGREFTLLNAQIALTTASHTEGDI